MNFAQQLAKATASEIAVLLHCPIRIVYAWKAGQRQPRPWVQYLILEKLRTSAPRAK